MPDENSYIDDLNYAMSFREFEIYSWRDAALIPWWILRWAFAFWWTVLWALSRELRHGPTPWNWMWGRRESPEPVICERCLWAGPRRWVIHTYTGTGEDGDAEACDECPRCGKEL